MSDTKDFHIENGVLISYLGSDNRVEVPDGVTSIGENAFNDSNIEEIVITEGGKRLSPKKILRLCLRMLKTLSIRL